MKAIIFYFAGQNFKPITGYDHNSEIPHDKIFDIQKEIFEKGLNVMLYHTNGSNTDNDVKVILFVDDRRFTSR